MGELTNLYTTHIFTTNLSVLSSKMRNIQMFTHGNKNEENKYTY